MKKSAFALKNRVALAGLALLVSLPALASGAHSLVVVEIFQSQGCSSCPPAEANVNALAGKPGVLALSFAVTYWDDLGWKDTFAKPAYTNRQWDYAHAHGRDQVWTPQVYINGRTDLVGADRGELDAAVRHAAAAPAAALPATWSPGKLHLASSQAGNYQVWLVRYDPRTVKTPIGAGENRGRLLPHRDVVHQLVHLGEWNGNPADFTLPAPMQGGLRTAVLVQTGKGGPILGASVEGG